MIWPGSQESEGKLKSKPAGVPARNTTPDKAAARAVSQPGTTGRTGAQQPGVDEVALSETAAAEVVDPVICPARDELQVGRDGRTGERYLVRDAVPRAFLNGRLDPALRFEFRCRL
jgi:hypothetical protein